MPGIIHHYRTGPVGSTIRNTLSSRPIEVSPVPVDGSDESKPADTEEASAALPDVSELASNGHEPGSNS